MTSKQLKNKNSTLNKKTHKVLYVHTLRPVDRTFLYLFDILHYLTRKPLDGEFVRLISTQQCLFNLSLSRLLLVFKKKPDQKTGRPDPSVAAIFS